jgi:prepilin-type N-terminal cleavage/methylation domain-containing protein/prepilin-type processing-associated H-X9-DG protein
VNVLRVRRTGFTLIELLVVIAIIAILAAILFPVFARAREKARQSACQSNLKQLGIAATMYAQDYDEFMVPAWSMTNDQNGTCWADMLMPYNKSLQVMDCPSSGLKVSLINTNWGGQTVSRDVLSYGINTTYWGGHAGSASGPAANPPIRVSMSRIMAPAETVLLSDFYGRLETSGQYDLSTYYTAVPINAAVYRHNEQSNILFCDGHVKSMNQGALAATHSVGGTNVKYLFSIEED